MGLLASSLETHWKGMCTSLRNDSRNYKMSLRQGERELWIGKRKQGLRMFGLLFLKSVHPPCLLRPQLGMLTRKVRVRVRGVRSIKGLPSLLDLLMGSQDFERFLRGFPRSFEVMSALLFVWMTRTLWISSQLASIGFSKRWAIRIKGCLTAFRISLCYGPWDKSCRTFRSR